MTNSDTPKDTKEQSRARQRGAKRLPPGEAACTMQTFLIHGLSHSPKWEYGHHVTPPISSSITYRLESAERGAIAFEHFGTEEEARHPIYVYDRLGEPVRGMLEEALARAESGEYAVTFASGMAAIAGILGIFIRQGDEVIAHRSLYGCTYSLFANWYPRWGISVRFLNLTSLEELDSAVSEKTRVIFFESPANPTMEIIDIAGVREIADRYNAHRSPEQSINIVVDNTFATPFCQRPLTLGAHHVAHSLTKNIGGFGTDMGGAVVTSRGFLGSLLLYRKDFGGVLPPKSAWPILVYGLPSLSLRMKQQQESALKIASFLESHPKVQSVSYPGLPSFPQHDLARRQMRDYEGSFAPGSMVYFVLKGGGEGARAECRSFMNHVAQHAYSITLAVSLGQVRTLIESPSLMTHSSLSLEHQLQAGIDPCGVRLSIGLEDPRDIITDLGRALTQYKVL